MQKSYHKFLRSAVALPIMAAHLAFSPITGAVSGIPSVAAIFPEQNRNLASEALVNQQEALAVEIGAKIDAYYGQYDLPLEGKGYELAKTALEHGLPAESLAAMAMIESTGMRPGTCAQRTNNPFGYGSCKIKFNSVDEAIETVARTLAAENESTARFYEGKTFDQKLRVYNGYNADGAYVKKVNYVMSLIGKMEVAPGDALATAAPEKA